MTKTTKSVINARDAKSAMARGFKQTCPRCGESHMYRAYLKPTESCAHCGLDLSDHRADDAPPYMTIVLVGHIVVPIALEVQRLMEPAMWLQFLVWSVISVAMTLWALPRVKGALIGLQWAKEMHGFGNDHARNGELVATNYPLK